MTETLHPAQNRGFRELVAASRRAIEHLEALGKRFESNQRAHDACEDGAATTRELLNALRPAIAGHDLHGGSAAQGVGASAARAQSGVRDRFLERNQAIRLAALDVQHVSTLLAYLESVSATVGTTDLAELCHEWKGEMERVEERMRAAAVAVGRDPDYAIEPLDPSMFGRAAHSAQYWFGTFGEWFDRRSAEKSSD
jgi:hypothetical protein